MIGYIAQISMPEASTPSASAVLPLTTICGSVERVAGMRYLKSRLRLGPGVAGVEQLHVGLDDGRGLLAEGERDLLARELQVEAVDAAQHAEREHVLAAARVGDERAALALHRDLVDVVAGRDELVVGLDVGGGDLPVRVVAPHALEQDGAAGLELAGAHAPEQHLLVERDHEVGLVAAVGDRAARRCGCGCRSRRRRCAPAAGSRPG